MTTYKIDPDRCAQTRLCAEIAPALFHVDEDGFTVASQGSVDGAEALDALEAAASSCPALAIVLDKA